MKVKDPCSNKPKYVLRVATKTPLKRDGSTYTLSKLTEEQIKLIKKSCFSRSNSEGAFLRTRLQDLCYRLDQVNVVSAVSEKNCETAKQAKLRKDDKDSTGSTAQPIKSQTSSSSDTTTTSTTSDSFHNKQYPPEYIQYLEYLANPTAAARPPPLTRQKRYSMCRNFVKHKGKDLEKKLFVPSYYASSKTSDSSEDTNESKKSDTSSKVSESLDKSTTETKDIISTDLKKPFLSTSTSTSVSGSITAVEEESEFSIGQTIVKSIDRDSSSDSSNGKETDDSEEENQDFDFKKKS